MGNLGRVALLALGAMAVKKYVKPQMDSAAYGGGSLSGSSTGTELLDASGQPVPGAMPGASAMRANPNVAWIADPQLRARNLQRLKEMWSQRNNLL